MVGDKKSGALFGFFARAAGWRVILGFDAGFIAAQRRMVLRVAFILIVV